MDNIENMSLSEAMAARDRLVEHVAELKRKQVATTCEQVRQIISMMPHAQTFQEVCKALHDAGRRLEVRHIDNKWIYFFVASNRALLFFREDEAISAGVGLPRDSYSITSVEVNADRLKHLAQIQGGI